MTDVTLARPRFDGTINLGHLISLGGIAAAIIGAYWLMDFRLAAVERQIDRVSTLVIESARVDERLKDHSRRLELLEHPRTR
jgi:hypothetical protein